jgi:hypothetical protein
VGAGPFATGTGAALFVFHLRVGAGAETAAAGAGDFATCAGTGRTAGAATPATSPSRTAWRFGRGVAHMVQYLPPLLEWEHAPHSQAESVEKEDMRDLLFA